MKFKTELEFCVKTTEVVLGLLVGSGRKIIAVPEVPWSYFSNEQFDMLLLDIRNLQYLMIEYKLNDLCSLEYQVKRLGAAAIGIINTDTKTNNRSIFGYTGLDRQIERMGDIKQGINWKFRWASIYNGIGMMYYWAYKNNQSNLLGGKTGGGRAGFAAVYRQAIANLHAQYGSLDFMITHCVLQSGYSLSASRKHYRIASAAHERDH